MQDEPSEFRQGWRVLAASLLGIAVGISSLYFYSIGVFIKPLAETFGWSRGEASLGVLVGTLCTAVMAAPVGTLVDRVGSLRVALGSLVLLAVGLASMGAAVSSLATFIALTAVLSLTTAGSSPLPFTRLVVAAFEHRRGLALGITLSGTGIGAILVPALLTPFVAAHGWRAGYYVLAGVVIAALPVIWLLLHSAKTAPVVQGPSVPIGQIVRAPIFRLLSLMFFLASVAILGTVVHFVPMLTDAGFSPAEAGQTAALIGVAAIGGRLVAGMLLDRLAAGLVTGALFAFAAFGLTLLAIGGTSLAVPGALITGLAIGAEVDLLAFLVSLYFPRAVYGQVFGALYGLFLIGGAVGPALSGYLFDLSGDYRLSLLTASGLLGLAALSTLALSGCAAKNLIVAPGSGAR